MAKNNPINEYETKQAAIQTLLKKIEASLLDHDRNASSKPGGHTWGHVGDLGHAEAQLQEIYHCLAGKGEFSR